MSRISGEQAYHLYMKYENGANKRGTLAILIKMKSQQLEIKNTNLPDQRDQCCFPTA